MTYYILRRILWFFPVLVLTSIVSFAIIQLPPGDFLTGYIASLAQDGDTLSPAEVANLRERYGLDQSFLGQYFRWISGIVFRGDFGFSFEWRLPVWTLIGETVTLTVVLTFSTIFLTWMVALPIGILSAVRPYSIIDYVATFFGFIGKATPNFLLALILMWIFYAYFQIDATGLFSPEYASMPWSWGRVRDLISHLWIPLIVLGTSGTADLIRIMRANVLDEMSKPYVETARAQGLPEWRVVLRYPVRVALNPFLSTVGWALPQLFSGAVTTAVVLNLPIAGPLLLRALLSQDMFVAGAYILLLSVLTLIGTLISDILLAIFDPRIRME